MGLKIRLLLTNKCTARCSYCHNEGQGAGGNLLPLSTICHLLDTLATYGCQPSEIVLSGGEPTLHRQLAEIARLCKQSGAHVSLATHGGHPELLAPALPYLDEIKLHIDAFDPVQQRASMGIELDAALESARLARQYPLALCCNHPLRNSVEALHYLADTRAAGIDCKMIEWFDRPAAGPTLAQMDWAAAGYQPQSCGQWLHENGRHRLLTKRCTSRHNGRHTLFVGTDGIRRSLGGVLLGPAAGFHMGMLHTDKHCSLTRPLTKPPLNSVI
ncbi:radical SAM protein [Laribacter hongkongensis]|uniref:radical SAM protein n=1 Tax=Laribacter hongkongensis TaxID=168471 RepID=UPI001EFC47EF|nr:radical SAM protein [Laribacter hongkongensis]MCG9059812.1 radical SAM protein [Laribacter hongkongensis]MCG9084153.1 radical SAM protein [Laribacter hongkongensis]MCG9086552.1 radical SAM protein [Laribacter hongkongensis]